VKNSNANKKSNRKSSNLNLKTFRLKNFKTEFEFQRIFSVCSVFSVVFDFQFSENLPTVKAKIRWKFQRKNFNGNFKHQS